MYKVYMITNAINLERYVGFTSKPLDVRFEQHTTRKSCVKLKNALDFYGKENFKIELIQEFEDRNIALDYENIQIKEKNTLHPNGYNLAAGGRSSVMCDLTRQKMSESHKGLNKGRKLTQEWRDKISKTRIERKLKPSPESIKKGIETKKGLKMPKEFGEAISARQKGSDNPGAKTIICNQDSKVFTSLVEAAAYYDIDAQGITQVLKGRNKTVGKNKLTFSYKEIICN